MALAINIAQISGLLSRKLKISDIIMLKNEIKGVSFHRLIYVFIFLNIDTTQLLQSRIESICKKFHFLVNIMKIALK